MEVRGLLRALILIFLNKGLVRQSFLITVVFTPHAALPEFS